MGVLIRFLEVSDNERFVDHIFQHDDPNPRRPAISSRLDDHRSRATWGGYFSIPSFRRLHFSEHTWDRSSLNHEPYPLSTESTLTKIFASAHKFKIEFFGVFSFSTLWTDWVVGVCITSYLRIGCVSVGARETRQVKINERRGGRMDG